MFNVGPHITTLSFNSMCPPFSHFLISSRFSRPLAQLEQFLQLFVTLWRCWLVFDLPPTGLHFVAHMFKFPWFNYNWESVALDIIYIVNNCNYYVWGCNLRDGIPQQKKKLRGFCQHVLSLLLPNEIFVSLQKYDIVIELLGIISLLP